MKQIISIVIPCYCSGQYLGHTIEEIQEQFRRQSKYSYQLILVDDASPDHTYDVIQTACKKNPHITGIRLSTNFGQARARMAAIPYIKGDCAVFMDDDGQHPADAISMLADKVFEGYDLVYARFRSQKETLLRRVASTVTNWCMNSVTRKPGNVKITSFFAVSRFSVEKLQQYKSPYVFLGGYLFEITKKITTVEVKHRARTQGKSYYTFRKLYAMWLDNMLAFPHVLGRACRGLGLAAACLALAMFVAAITACSSTLALTGLILFCFGIFVFLVGVFGEIIVRIFCSMQGVPAYCIRETNADEESCHKI